MTISSLEQIPSFDAIRELPRNNKLKLVFDGAIQHRRETIGQELKNELKEFLVGIHITEPYITIAKLITDKEIVNNQSFFENCAKDYRKLAQQLIYKFADKLKVTIDHDTPMLTFGHLKNSKRQTGKMDEWIYYLHGAHCGFTNKRTGQNIEVSLIFGAEFGDLDPYFFSRFIKSTLAYQPLPIDIYEDYHDGIRINEVMLSLGKFEKIDSDCENHGIVVADRNAFENYSLRDRKARFDFLKLLGLK